MKVKIVITIMLVCLGVMTVSISVMAQGNDSLIAANSQIAPGDTGIISIYLHNTQFSVGGFSMRLILTDSLSATIIGVERGADIANFDYFGSIAHPGSCRATALAIMPNGHNQTALPIGYHEIARVAISIANDAPLGLIDHMLFQNDTLPPNFDNSISDSSGYRVVVPFLQGDSILISSEESGINERINIPTGIELSQNYPNPFNSETRLEFNISSSGQNVSLEIYDLLGRQIKNYYWGNLPAGLHGITWDGRNRFGQPLASGTYLYRLTTSEGASQVMKMTFLK